MKHSVTLLLIALMMVACKPTVPSEYIQPDAMEDILYDYHIGQAMGKSDYGAKGDYERNKLFVAVLKKHDITEADFDSSLVYYYSHIDRLQAIYRRVNERLAAEAKGLGTAIGELNQYSKYSTTGDTANIWRQTSELLLVPRPTMNCFNFKVKADSTFRLGDSFMLQFLSQFVWQGGAKDAVVCVRTAYEGDSVIQTFMHINNNGLTQLRIPYNRTLKVKELRGFVYLTDNNNDATDMKKLMSVSQIQLIRFHNKEIQNAYKTTQRDTLAADSVQRSADSRRPVADTASAQPVGQGLRSKTAPFRRGGATDRVASGPSRVR